MLISTTVSARGPEKAAGKASARMAPEFSALGATCLSSGGSGVRQNQIDLEGQRVEPGRRACFELLELHAGDLQGPRAGAQAVEDRLRRVDCGVGSIVRPEHDVERGGCRGVVAPVGDE